MKKNIHEIIDTLSNLLINLQEDISRTEMSENLINAIQEAGEINDDYYESGTSETMNKFN